MFRIGCVLKYYFCNSFENAYYFDTELVVLFSVLQFDLELTELAIFTASE